MIMNGQNTFHFSKPMKGNFYVNGLKRSEEAREMT